MPCEGLSVNFLVYMEDVTQQINDAVNDDMSQNERQKKINEISKNIVDKATKNTHYKGMVESYFHDNQYFLLVYETFEDVRLVGCPPSGIGKFGGDTDNWEWPRHTGDFSVFRIYADENNKPAKFSPNNKPYKPKKYLNISLDGLKEGDFTMVFGYPGYTNEYAPSEYVNNVVNVENPVIIGIRDKKLEVMKKYSELSPKIRIQYANKIAGVANGWKKMIGQSQGINNINGVDGKRNYEQQFQNWANQTKAYKNVLPLLNNHYKEVAPYRQSLLYLAEAGLGVEIVRFANHFNKLIEASEQNKDVNTIDSLKMQLKKNAVTFFKDYCIDIDKELCPELLEEYYRNVPENLRPDFFEVVNKKHHGNFESFANELFAQSILVDSAKFYRFIDNYRAGDYKTLKNDAAYKIYNSISEMRKKIGAQIVVKQHSIDSLMRYYMKAQMEFESDKTFYPDANFTLRVAYGKMEGFNPADGIRYTPFTTLEGVMNKENPNVYDYVVDDKLKQLYREKNYGRYADDDGSMHVCFLASNHTTGGNSGSPVLNAKGELVGLNFDRNWQGTMSDIVYDPAVCRNIIVDIRYVLFIIDKFAGAKHLVDEMKIANTKLQYQINN